LSLRSGGIVALPLNRRLTAGNPPGSPGPGWRRSRNRSQLFADVAVVEILANREEFTVS